MQAAPISKQITYCNMLKIISDYVIFHLRLDSAAHYYEESLSTYRSSLGPQATVTLNLQDDYCRFLLLTGQQEVSPAYTHILTHTPIDHQHQWSNRTNSMPSKCLQHHRHLCSVALRGLTFSRGLPSLTWHCGNPPCSQSCHVYRDSLICY